MFLDVLNDPAGPGVQRCTVRVEDALRTGGPRWLAVTVLLHMAGGCRDLTLDLGNMPFIDGEVIAQILKLAQHPSRPAFTLINITDYVKSRFEQAGLTHLICTTPPDRPAGVLQGANT